MRTLRVFLPMLLLSVALFLPHAALAADTNFFGELYPDSCKCDAEHNNGVASAPEFGCSVQVLQNILNLGISLGVVIFVLVAAYAGFLWMTSSMNAENRTKGRTMLLSAFIGLVIALSAWLIVDFVMAALYNPDKGWGPWHRILEPNADSKNCVVPTDQGQIQGADGRSNIDTVVEGQPVTRAPVSGHDSSFDYEPNVSLQNPARSNELNSLLSCMVQRVPANVGRISAITDTYVGTDGQRIEHCASVGSQGDSSCKHTVGSCHYGGSACSTGHKSYAVDFGDEENAQAIIGAANGCGAIRAAIENGNHVHVAAPNACGSPSGGHSTGSCR